MYCEGKIEITRNADFAAENHLTMWPLFQPSQYDCVHVKLIKIPFIHGVVVKYRNNKR
jgi:hypothetical protein